MKSKVLPLSFPFFLLFAAPTSSFAYIGQPSFSLDDDYDYRSLRSEMDQARLRAERVNHRAREAATNLRNQKQNLEENRAKLAQIPADVNNTNVRIQNLQVQINTLQTENSKMQQALGQSQVMLKQAQDSITAKNAELAAAELNLKNLQNQCKTQPANSCVAQIQQANTNIANIKGALSAQQSHLTQTQNIIRELTAKIQQNAKQITENQNQIAKANLRKQELNRALSDLQRDIPALEQSVRNMTAELNHIEAEVRKSMEQAHRSVSEFERFAHDLQMDIEHYNKSGASEGENDARHDGYDMAQSMGNSIGQQDGRNDGLSDGTSAGRERDYNNGQSLGLADGRKDGIAKGTDQGRYEGIVKALTEVGAKEGTASGINKAQKSDAVQVGTQQGATAGLNRAVATGKINGVKLANEQGLKKHESVSLKKVNLNGPFSGLFSRSTPHLPSEFKGRNYSPSVSYGREILRRAFQDGYDSTYEYAVEAEFERNIGSIYNSSYDSAYRTSYDSAVAQTYRDSYDSGYDDGYKTVYSNQFEQSRKIQHAVSYKETLNNPDRNSAVYKESFKTNENNTYINKYEEIRSKTFTVVEADTFNKNIQQKTEESRQRRSLEVDDLFEKHPVLAFVSSEIHDGGVNGITRRDGVFQPGETIIHSVTIKNFGKQPMNDATIVSSSGQSQKLPQIPAQSELTIKGAVVSTIDPKTEQEKVHQSSIRIKAPRTSQDSLQTGHYQNAAESLLVNADSKQVKVFYPIYVSGVNNHFDSLRINQVQPLQLSLMNFSNVIYRNVDVELASNAPTDIVLRKFEQIPEVNSGLEIQDGKIMPSRFELGKVVEVKATLKYKGVTVGVIEEPVSFTVVK